MIEVLPNWHPIFVHFTVALMSVAALCFLFAHLFQGSQSRDQLLNVAKWNFWIGSLSAIATVLAGWYAFNTVNHDTPSHTAMTMHRNWALVTLVVILILDGWLWRIQKVRTTGITNSFAVVLIVLLCLLGSTAWQGGELVYRYGLGVMSLPAAGGGDGHDHDHGDSHTDSMPHEAAPMEHEINSNTMHEENEHMHDEPVGALQDKIDKPAVEPVKPADNVQPHDDGHSSHNH